jgi:homoserine O-acetyltransferase
LVIGIKSDILYPPQEQEFLANHIPSADLKIMDFSHGHDAFLIETDEINQYLLSWL